MSNTARFVYMGKVPDTRTAKIEHELLRLNDDGSPSDRIIRTSTLPKAGALKWARPSQVFSIPQHEEDGVITYGVGQAQYVGLWTDVCDNEKALAEVQRQCKQMQALNMLAQTKAQADAEWLENEVIQAVKTLQQAAMRMSDTDRNRLLIYIGKKLG